MAKCGPRLRPNDRMLPVFHSNGSSQSYRGRISIREDLGSLHKREDIYWNELGFLFKISFSPSSLSPLKTKKKLIQKFWSLVYLFVFPGKFSSSIYAYVGGWRCRFYATGFSSSNSNNFTETIIRKMLSPYLQNAGEIRLTQENRDSKY